MFPFSFGPFIGFWSAFECAVEAGNTVMPCGGIPATRERIEEAWNARVFDHAGMRPEVRLVGRGSLPRFEMKARRVVNVEKECE